MSEVKDNIYNACSNESQAESSACLAGAQEGQSSCEKRSFSQEEIQIAQKAYLDVYCKGSLYEFPIEKVREEQIAQIYYSILEKGEEHVKNPEVWRATLESEVDKEADDIINKTFSENGLNVLEFKDFLSSVDCPLRMWTDLYKLRYGKFDEKDWECARKCAHIVRYSKISPNKKYKPKTNSRYKSQK